MNKTISIYDSKYDAIVAKTENFVIMEKSFENLDLILTDECRERIKPGMLINIEQRNESIPYRVFIVEDATINHVRLACNNILFDFNCKITFGLRYLTLTPKQHLEKIFANDLAWQVGSVCINEPIGALYDWCTVHQFLNGLLNTIYLKTGKGLAYHYEIQPQKKFVISIIDGQQNKTAATV